MVYPDLEFVLSLLTNGEHSQEAGRLLRAHSLLPLSLSIVHRLQVENSLLRFLHDPNAEVRATAHDSLLVWQHYFGEEVFVLRDFDLPSAFSQTAGWNAEYRVKPPRWHLLIHVALAANVGATLLSFEPIVRKKASEAGVSLLPATL